MSDEMGLEIDIEQSATLGAIAGALAAAQGEIDNAVKDSANPHFKSKYADLATVRDAVTPALSKHKIAVSQQVLTRADGTVGVRTLLLHSSGEYLGSRAWCRPAQPGPQPLGSVITYLRRYMLAAAVGVAQEDDDGNVGQASGPQRYEREEPRQEQRQAPRQAPAVREVEHPSVVGEAFPRITATMAGNVDAAIRHLQPDSLPAARLAYAGWALGRKVGRYSELNTAEASVILAKAKAGEMPDESGVA